MKLRLSARGVELSAELKAYVKRRVHFRLGRFAGQLESLSVRLGHVDGPPGGLDKYCDIRIEGSVRRPVIVREHQASIEAAVAYATERAERAVRRQMNLAARVDRRNGSGQL